MLLTDFNFITLVLMLSASLFFLMVGVRSLKNQNLDGLLFLTLSVFFATAHMFYLFNLPVNSPASFALSNINLWVWASILFAPSLIILFISFGIINFTLDHFRVGMIKIFFGLTLLCYIFMIGDLWAFDVRGIITILFCFIWFEVEFKTAT